MVVDTRWALSQGHGRCPFLISLRSSRQEVCLRRGQESMSTIGQSVMERAKAKNVTGLKLIMSKN